MEQQVVTEEQRQRLIEMREKLLAGRVHNEPSQPTNEHPQLKPGATEAEQSEP
jgi:hypothetical protein